MTVRPLGYQEQLTLEEAGERLGEVQQEFDSLKAKYTTGLRKYQFWMPKRDQGRLSGCVGVLLPLGFQRAVQEEAGSAPDPQQTIQYEASSLQMKILDMLASFSNTRTTRLGYYRSSL